MNFNVNKFECIEKILREYNYDFELVRVIDDKCFSGCFIVKNKKLANRYEIIKFIDSVEKEVIDNFKSEINVLSILNHSNIPKIYDVLIDKDIVLFRCEYVNGMSLEELIKICKKKNIYLSEVFILNLILKLSDALYYTHNELKSNGQKVEIIHCDVKPSNVLVKIDEKDLKNNFNLDNLEVYLIDFGIFILQNEIRNNFVGSINYMSKWQIENKKIDWRTDVYQLTLLYLELLTNEKPFSKFSYKKIVELKKNDEINIPKNISISKINFIKKGTFTNENKKYLDEKDFLNDLNKLYIRQKVLKKFNDNKMFIKGFFLFSFCLLFFNMSYLVYDYKFNSVYSMLKIVEDNDNLSLDELEHVLNNIQKRSFEKKYLSSLLDGYFIDKNNSLLYPSFLDDRGEWILIKNHLEASGAFVGLLYDNSNDDLKVLNIANKYVDDILKSSYRGSDENRYTYALISAYQHTGDEKYVNSLKNISEEIIVAFEKKQGLNQIRDMYYYELFLFLYNYTGNKKYLDVFENRVKDFIKYNINENGYVYENSIINFTSPMGFIREDKSNVLLVELDDKKIGKRLSNNYSNLEYFENKTSCFTRDFAIVLIALNSLYDVTNDSLYEDTIERMVDYYIKNNLVEGVDYLFVFRAGNLEIPYDILATVRMVDFFKEYNSSLYEKKLRSLLDLSNFNLKYDHGILVNNVKINGFQYQHNAHELINQTFVLTDREFLNI